MMCQRLAILDRQKQRLKWLYEESGLTLAVKRQFPVITSSLRSCGSLPRPFHHDPKHLARNPRSAAQVQDHLRHLVRRSHPALRVKTSNRLQDFLALAPEEELRAYRTRSYGVDEDAVPVKIFAEHASHLLNRTFGCIVQEIWRTDSGRSCQGGGEKHSV